MRPSKRRRSGGNSERLIAYCGLYCGDCPRFGNKTSGLAQELKARLEASGFARAGRSRSARRHGLQGFETFWKMLGMIADHECPGCHETGCSVKCRIRPCCIGRGLAGCWECAKFASCTEFHGLRKVHGKGIAYNLRALARKGAKEFLRGKRFWLGREVRSEGSKGGRE
jgi:hypothetical protein